MRNKGPIQLDHRIHLINGFDLDVQARTGTYIIDEAELTLVETGPSPSVKYIKRGLESLGFSLDQVKYIVVTHIHLDHSGGAGLLLRDCPNATVVVHSRGARHLAEPRKLATGARAIYGDSFEELFEPIVPVAEEQLLVEGEEDTVKNGADCTRRVLDAPGHSIHHLSMYEPVRNGIFTGETTGIQYEQLARVGIDFFLQRTAPKHYGP